MIKRIGIFSAKTVIILQQKLIVGRKTLPYRTKRLIFIFIITHLAPILSYARQNPEVKPKTLNHPTAKQIFLSFRCD